MHAYQPEVRIQVTDNTRAMSYYSMFLYLKISRSVCCVTYACLFVFALFIYPAPDPSSRYNDIQCPQGLPLPPWNGHVAGGVWAHLANELPSSTCIPSMNWGAIPRQNQKPCRPVVHTKPLFTTIKLHTKCNRSDVYCYLVHLLSQKGAGRERNVVDKVLYQCNDRVVLYRWSVCACSYPCLYQSP